MRNRFTRRSSCTSGRASVDRRGLAAGERERAAVDLLDLGRDDVGEVAARDRAGRARVLGHPRREVRLPPPAWKSKCSGYVQHGPV